MLARMGDQLRCLRLQLTMSSRERERNPIRIFGKEYHSGIRFRILQSERLQTGILERRVFL